MPEGIFLFISLTCACSRTPASYCVGKTSVVSSLKLFGHVIVRTRGVSLCTSCVFICKMGRIIVIAVYPSPRARPSLTHIKNSMNFICYNYEFNCLQISLLDDTQPRVGRKEGLPDHHSLKVGCSSGAGNEGDLFQSPVTQGQATTGAWHFWIAHGRQNVELPAGHEERDSWWGRGNSVPRLEYW